MAIIKMIAIEYNMWMSIIELIKDTIKSTTIGYDGFNNDIDIPVLPAYPRDLTKFTKPSIIVQKVGTDSAPISFGSFIGQYFDDEQGAYLDSYGINHDSTFQIDVCSDSNTQRSLITSLLIDELFNKIRFIDSGQIKIFDYASSLSNPQLMGFAKLDYSIDIQNLDRKYSSDNEYKLQNNDYATAIRFDISMIQAIIPENQKLVDLTKWIKVSQRVKL
jgi:hypothetical protein